jgi:hypothetical protein
MNARMLLLPKTFDSNEIYILCIGFFLLLLFLALPKKFSTTGTTLILLFNFFLSAVIDQILAGSILNFYDIMDDPKFEVMDLFIYIFIYPIAGYLFLYIFTFINEKFSVLYILIAAFVTIALERVSVMFNVYTYVQWNLFYSGLSYLSLYSFNLIFLKWLRNNVH